MHGRARFAVFERMIRVYNKRGFTGIEFEMKEERADLVAKELLSLEDEGQWYPVAQAHLLDYVDFKTDWWGSFIQANKRAGVTLSKPDSVALNKLVNWMDSSFPLSERCVRNLSHRHNTHRC